MLTIKLSIMQIFAKAIRRALLLSIIVLITGAAAIAQNENTATASASQQTVGITVTGTVRDAATGNPLAGINITVRGYSASLTDDKGFFSINVPDKSSSVMVTGPGYQRMEIALKGRETVEVSLFEDSYKSIYDEARMPYKNKAMSQIPYSVSSLNTGGNWERTVETPDNYLQGRIAGLNVIRRSGTPAMGANMFLRGFTSLYATNQPLLVVDGVMYDANSYGNSLITGHVTNPLADIDVKDIDNITVIKDGASMYGTKGANGVILITTGKAEDVATRIDFAAYGGFNSAVRQLPVMGVDEYRIYLSDVLKTSGMTDDEILSLPYMNDDVTDPDYYRYHSLTNWQDQVLANSFNQNYHLKVTGGDDIAIYALSLGTTKNKGIIDNTGLARYFMRFNANLKLSSKLTGDANLSFTSSEQELKDQGINTKTNPLYLGLVKAPFLPVYQLGDDGSQSPNLADADILNVSNAVSVIEDVQDVNRNYRFSGSVGLNYELTRNINISTILGLTFDKVRERFFVPSNGITHDTLPLAIARNRSGSNVQRLFSLYNDTRISYNKTLNYIHDISVNAGLRYQNNSTQSDFGLGYNSATDDFVSVGNGVNTLRKVGGEVGDWNWLNMYLNADYSLKSKYLLSINAAVDGSSRFGKEIDKGMRLTFSKNKYAVLPSIAAGWLASSENFMSQVKYIDLLKLRVSYGLVGNDDIGNYNARQYYVTQNLLGVQGLVRGNLANPELKWENVSKFNAGIDIVLLQERLGLNLDYFLNSTIDMLMYEPVSSISGFDYTFSNSGGMKTSGIELALNGRVLNKEVKLDIGLNLATAKSEITKLPDDQILTEIGNATIITKTGQAPNLFYGFQTDGIYQSAAEASSSGLAYKNSDGTTTPFQAGDVRFIDNETNSVIDEGDMVVIGDPNPDFVGSISAIASWKRLSFDALFTFSKGNDIYNYTRYMLESMSGYNNQLQIAENRWRTEGQVTSVPRAAWGDPSGNSRFSDRWIEDGSYLRLRTVSLTYDVPVKEGIIIKYVKVYATANNLFTLTKYLGYDPEFNSSASVFTQGVDVGLEPQFKTIQLGVRIGL
jgi:TonB-linked SusC/RagA family outer membrane protein